MLCLQKNCCASAQIARRPSCVAMPGLQRQRQLTIWSPPWNCGQTMRGRSGRRGSPPSISRQSTPIEASEEGQKSVVSADSVEPTQELSADDSDVSDDEAEADHNLADRSKCLACLDVLPLQAGGEDLTTLSCQHTFHSYCLQNWANIQGCHVADVRCPGRCVVDRQAAAASQVEVMMAPESLLRLMAIQS